MCDKLPFPPSVAFECSVELFASCVVVSFVLGRSVVFCWENAGAVADTKNTEPSITADRTIPTLKLFFLLFLNFICHGLYNTHFIDAINIIYVRNPPMKNKNI